MIEEKICKGCNKKLPATREYFYNHRECKGGLDSRCKECRLLYDKQLKKFGIRKRKIPREGYKICSKCGEELLAIPEHFRRSKRCSYGLISICKTCMKKLDKKYRLENKDKIKEQHKRFRRIHRKEINNKLREWYHESKTEELLEKSRKYQIEFRKSEKGKRYRIVYYREHKYTDRYKQHGKKSKSRRKRNLNWIPIMDNPFPEEIRIDWHHINNWIVIPLPKIIHRNKLGRNHREQCDEWIRKCLMLDFNYLISSLNRKVGE